MRHVYWRPVQGVSLPITTDRTVGRHTAQGKEGTMDGGMSTRYTKRYVMLAVGFFDV